jgi:F-box and WD-40 domain protein CDC4
MQVTAGIPRSMIATGQYTTPNKLSKQQTRANASAADNMPNTRKRASPVSLREAAELASLQRRNKKPRPSLPRHTMDTPDTRAPKSRLSQSFGDDTSPVITPVTDISNATEFRVPTKKPRLRSRKEVTIKSSVAEESSVGTLQGLFGRATGWAKQSQASSSENSRPVAALSTTPPIVESDLELVEQEEPLREQIPQHRRPTPLDTLSAQDASLPSPSLSPITAAANLNGDFDDEESVYEDANEISSLDISEDNQRRRRTNLITPPSHLEMPAIGDFGNPQLPTPTLMDIPTMLDSFDAMPTEVQSYIMYHMLRRCAKPTLHMIADVVNPALKCDFLALLPLELSMIVVRHFDVQTMCRAAQVSKKWRHIVDSDEKAWKTLLDTDGFVLPAGDIERAVKEGWGWQSPDGPNGCEVDLSPAVVDLTSSTPLSSPPESAGEYGDYGTPATSSRPKRKAAKHHSNRDGKKRKTKASSSSSSKVKAAPWLQSLDSAQGPIGYANAAALAVPNPEVGLPSLRNLHLYKSLYRRHYAIKKGWMDEDTRPKHLAFRAHGRHVVTCLQFDGDKIITGSDDTHIHVYDTKTGREIKRLIGHEGGVWALQYDGNTLVSGSTDRSVRVWDIAKGKCVQQFHGHTSTVRCLVILKPTKIGETADGRPIMMPKVPLIITGSRDSNLRVWKLPQPGDRSIMQQSPIANENDNPYFIRVLTGHHHSVRAIAAHGDTLVSGSYDSTVRVWKISTGDLLHRLGGHTAKVYSVVLDHERNRCISGSMDNTVRVWSLETGAQLYSLDGHTSLVGLLDLNYGRLVSAAADSTLRIWDPENGHCKSTLSAHTGAITCFQHDDQKVISGSDRTLKLWNVKTGECVKDLLTDLSGVWQVKFNDRRCVAAVQREQSTYIEVSFMTDFGN